MIDSRPPARMHGTDRRQQLLETALEIFSRRGFEGATTKEIAAAAGVNEAVIFRHFPNKQALYAEVLEYHRHDCEFQGWLDRARAFMESSDDEGLFRSIAQAILASHRRDPRGHRVLLFAALEGHEQGLEHHRTISIPIFELLNDYLVRRQSEGALAGIAPAVILSAIAGMATHYAMMTQMFGFDCHTPDEEVVEGFVQIMMRGIRPTPSKE